MARLPWYAFLYRLFGAQGTFWLWVLCIVALWWTAKPTLLRLTKERGPVHQHRAAPVQQVGQFLAESDPRRAALALAWQVLWVALILKLAAAVFRRSVLKSGPSRRRFWQRKSQA